MKITPCKDPWYLEAWQFYSWFQWPKAEDPRKHCWKWQGKYKAGYGRFGKELAHRASWRIHNQKNIPKDKVIRHLCHNPKCVNPFHLCLGSQKQNMADMISAGRQGFVRKLDAQQVKEIRASDDTLSTLAKRYKVSKTTIHRVRNI